MLAKYTLSALVAAMAHGATAAFNDSCSWWDIHGRVTLTADCVGSNPANVVTSSLDLNQCIGIDQRANALIWQRNGQAFSMTSMGPTFCGKCHLQSGALVMQCKCIKHLAGSTSSSVNLNDRINVDEEGRLFC